MSRKSSNPVSVPKEHMWGLPAMVSSTGVVICAVVGEHVPLVCGPGVL